MSNVIKVRVDFEYDAKLARAVNNFYGRAGRATDAEMRSWFYTYGTSANMDIVEELAEEIAEIRAETPDEEFAE
tara:strand:- start:107 stop:328 length:222 start_codon:yes stop_codon:yes gene_type:complete